MFCITELLMPFSVNFRHSALKRAEIWEDRLNGSREIWFCDKNGEKLKYIYKTYIKYKIYVMHKRTFRKCQTFSFKSAEIWEDMLNSSRGI